MTYSLAPPAPSQPEGAGGARLVELSASPINIGVKVLDTWEYQQSFSYIY